MSDPTVRPLAQPGPQRRFRKIILGLLGIGVLAWLWSAWHAHAQKTLVVYCAHDSIHAEAVLRDFEKRSGIPVSIRYDTEATKSLGLVELLIREKDAPRCDVFWNGELLGMAALAERGVLQPYRGMHFDRIPARSRDAEARWIGFAARLRVWIYHTARIPPTEAATVISARLRSGDLSRCAVAKPLFGTRLTEYAALWDSWGAVAVQQWHEETRRAGLREVNGNAAVKDAVAAGVCDFGLTDTDDFFSARDAGRPVGMLPVWLEDGTTLCIPNAVAIIRGTRHAEAAGKLVDFLTSAETELALARSSARQIPLGPVPDEALPAEVRELRASAQYGRDLRGLLPARAACLAWLKGLESR